MALYEALYGRRCRSPVHWDEVGERNSLRTRVSSADYRYRDHVFVRIAHMNGCDALWKERQAQFEDIGLFEILEEVGTLAYRIAVPPSPATVHNIFHVLMLRKYISNPSHGLDHEPLELTHVRRRGLGREFFPWSRSGG
ncbi:uncharacterized protein [Henckelia pumila]|uniref:uncharacterized protein n=1 Tax=Henckelia pumila TaxID=405737 RepID=UPI003C6E7630